MEAWKKGEEALSSLGEEMFICINSWYKGPGADTQHSVALQFTLLVPDLCPQDQEDPVPTGKGPCTLPSEQWAQDGTLEMPLSQ